MIGALAALLPLFLIIYLLIFITYQLRLKQIEHLAQSQKLELKSDQSECDDQFLNPKRDN